MSKAIKGESAIEVVIDGQKVFAEPYVNQKGADAYRASAKVYINGNKHQLNLFLTHVYSEIEKKSLGIIYEKQKAKK